MKLFARWLIAGLLLLAPLTPAWAVPGALLNATITGTGGTSAFYLKPNQQAVLFLAGGSATIQVEESPDNGATWYKITPAGTQIYIYTLTGDNQSDTLEGSANGVTYRFNCTSFTSNVTVTVLPQLAL